MNLSLDTIIGLGFVVLGVVVLIIGWNVYPRKDK